MKSEYGTVYFADASALVKLFVKEDGSTALREFLDKQGVFYTTLLCFAEALAVMKRKRFFEQCAFSQEQYISATNILRASIKSSQIKFAEQGDLTEPHVFYEAADLSDKYSIDLSDALQIVVVRRSRIVGATLITADRDLAEAARAEGISVWDCLREAHPSGVVY
jgi:predicted nucleic acid-binding protein